MTDSLFAEFGEKLTNENTNDCIKCTTKVMTAHAICLASAGDDEAKKKICLTATQAAMKKCPCP